jgi:biotin carboxyl carrier protein
METITVTLDGHTFQVQIDPLPASGARLSARVNGQPVSVLIPEHGQVVEDIDWIIVDDRPYEITLDAELRWIKSYSGLHQLEVHAAGVKATRPRGGDGRVKAPIPGQITRVLVDVGQTVEAGQPLLVLEAMKMENEIRAPSAGAIVAVNVTPGRGVALHEVLLEIN